MKFKFKLNNSEGNALKNMAKELKVEPEIFILAIVNKFARYLSLAIIGRHPHGVTAAQMIRDIEHEFKVLKVK